MKFFVKMLMVSVFVLSSCMEEYEIYSPQEPNTDLLVAQQDDPDEIITLNSGIVVVKKGVDYYFGGDIILTESQLESLDKMGGLFFSSEVDEPIDISGATKMPMQSGMRYYFPNRSTDTENQVYKGIGTKATGIYPDPYRLWSMLRYTLDSNLTSYQLMEINYAIAHIESNSNVRFYNATGQPTTIGGVPCDYINFTNVGSANSSSYIGRIGGKQNLNLNTYAFDGIIVHEIWHAIGMYHEHQRYDRDSYVNVNLSNVATANQSNFTKITTNYSIIGSFDFNSITLYGSFDFAVNQSVPVMTMVGSGNTFDGQRYGLSTLDRSWANNLYLPFIARPDTWADLAPTVYKPDNTVMNSTERENLIRALNNGSLPPPIPSYTVSFNLNSAPGTPPSNQTVNWGCYATTPSVPNWTGYTFGGWYDNSNCTGSAVNFSTYQITGTKTFYAKWTGSGPPIAKVKVINNTGNQVNGNIQIPNSGFNWGISMGAYSTSPSSDWHSVTLTPGTYYSAKGFISNFDDPPPSYWYRNINLQFGTSSSSPPQIASWTQAWDGSSQDRSIFLNIANGNTYYVIVTLY